MAVIPFVQTLVSTLNPRLSELFLSEGSAVGGSQSATTSPTAIPSTTATSQKPSEHSIVHVCSTVLLQ